jgi:hypothetical protein
MIKGPGESFLCSRQTLGMDAVELAYQSEVVCLGYRLPRVGRPTTRRVSVKRVRGCSLGAGQRWKRQSDCHKEDRLDGYLCISFIGLSALNACSHREHNATGGREIVIAKGKSLPLPAPAASQIPRKIDKLKFLLNVFSLQNAHNHKVRP